MLQEWRRWQEAEETEKRRRHEAEQVGKLQYKKLRQGTRRSRKTTESTYTKNRTTTEHTNIRIWRKAKQDLMWGADKQKSFEDMENKCKGIQLSLIHI